MPQPTTFSRPEELNARLAYLGRDRYHLFVNGRWLYAFSPAAVGEFLQAFRLFTRWGHACTAVTGGEIVFYSRRPAPEGEASK